MNTLYFIFVLLSLLLGAVKVEDQLADDALWYGSISENGSGSSSEPYTERAKREEDEAHYEFFVQMDESLNDKYQLIIDECTYPDENDTDTVATLLRMTDEYKYIRQRWLELFPTTEYHSDDISFNQQHIQIGDQQLNNVKYISKYVIVTQMWKENAKILSRLLPLTLKWHTAFDFTDGRITSEKTEIYLKEFRVSLQALDDAIQELNSLKQHTSLYVVCLNESMPENYLKDARKTIEEKSKIMSFYITAIIFGKTVEPILLCLILVLSIAWNASMYIMYLLGNKVERDLEYTILNLTFIGVAKPIIELTLFYQQAYFPSYLLLDSITFTILYVFFQSAAGFSILIFCFRRKLVKNEDISFCNLPPIAINLFYILLVWLLGFFITFASGHYLVILEHYKKSKDVLTFHMIFFVVFGVLIPLLMAAFNILFSRRMTEIFLETKGEGTYHQLEKIQKNVSEFATVVSFAFCAALILDFLRILILCSSYQESESHEAFYQFTFRTIIYVLYSIEMCIYPLVFYLACGHYRKAFNHTVLRCSRSGKRTPNEKQNESGQFDVRHV